MIRIAVVILNWNGLHHLKTFLPSICRHSNVPGTRVIVADNGSTDDSVEYVRQNFPGVELIAFTQNYGFAPGYFKALKQIEAEYFVLLNSDVEVTAGWLEPLVAAMDAEPGMGACMPKIRDYRRREYFEYAGAAGGYIDLFGYPFCRGRLLSSVEKDTGQYDDNVNIFWASGACMFVRSMAYFRAGGLDSDFFAHMEEIDLCWRLRRIGYTVKAIPQSIVYHIGGGTLPNNNPHKLYLNYRNNLYLLFKNLPGIKLLPVIFFRMNLDGLSAIAYLFSGSFGSFKAVIKAHRVFYGNLPRLVRKRIELKGTIGKAHIKEIFPGSILFNFFVRKKRYFNELDW
jgi:GT2 family glycosyltransferase